ELADARDSKSRDLHWSCGFDPHLQHHAWKLIFIDNCLMLGQARRRTASSASAASPPPVRIKLVGSGRKAIVNRFGGEGTAPRELPRTMYEPGRMAPGASISHQEMSTPQLDIVPDTDPLAVAKTKHPGLKAACVKVGPSIVNGG